MTENRKILLINDIPGVGKVAISAMTPVLSSMGFGISTLPTALISNTLDFGKFEIMETTDYMRKTLEVWKELGFKFDGVCIGYIASKAQIEIIKGLLEYYDDMLNFSILDPIMGDNGKLYNGIGDEHVVSMTELIKHAEIIVPNLTEALVLAGRKPLTYEDLGHEDIGNLLKDLKAKGAKSIVITSCKLKDEGQYFVYGYDAKEGKVFRVPYKLIGGGCPGSGDIFSAILAGNILRGNSLEDSTRLAVDFMSEMFLYLDDNSLDYLGFPIEAYLSERKI